MHRDEQEIRELVSTWIEATKAGDFETVLSLMTDDVVFLVPGRPVMRKSDFAAQVEGQTGASAAQFDGQSEIQEVQIFGDWAFIWTRLTVVVTPPDGHPPIIRKGPTLTIFKKENGKWLLARDANLLTTVSPTEE